MLNDRPKKKTRVSNRACLLSLLVLIAIGTAVSVVTRHISGASRLSRTFEQLESSASRNLGNCTPSSKAPICKWAQQYSRASRKRPADWKPKPGWLEDTVNSKRQVHHISDRSLAAAEKFAVPSVSGSATPRPLQAVLDTVWLPHEQPSTAKQKATELPQCGPLAGQSCVILAGNSSIALAGKQGCLVVRVMDSQKTCSQQADVWITHQLPSSSQYLGITTGDQDCTQEQVLQGTKAVWFLGGRLDQVQAVYSSNAFKTTSAVHFPLDVWKQQYVSRLQVETKATDKQPSSLFVGLMSVLECVPGTTSVHVYINKQTQSLCEQCNDAFEHSFMRNLTQASLISSHQCDEGGCEAQTGSVDPVEHGAMTAGVKLYIHKSKWQQSKGKVYADEEEDDEDEDV